MELIFYTLISIIILSVIVFVVFELRGNKTTADGKEDFLLILGYSIRQDMVHPTLRLRCERAAEYLRENKSAKAIACGGIVHKDQTKSEAQAIREILLSLGVEDERIILEDKSRTTVENFLNAKKIIDSCTEGSEAALLSSEFHIFRAELIARKCGLRCRKVAAPSPKNERLKNYIREYFALIIFFVGGK